MSKESKFTSFDGTKISYRVAGRGSKTILCFNGIGAAKWTWLPLEEAFKDRFRIITWDYRGHGLSETPKDTTKVTFEDLVEDALFLIKILKIKKAVLLGHSSGFHVALECFNKKPALAQSLISCLGTHGKTLLTFLDSFTGQLVFDIGYILNAVAPETSHWINTNLLAHPYTYQIGALLKLVNPAIQGRTDIHKYLEHFLELDLGLFNQLIALESKRSAENILKKINIPTLLIASEYDRFVPQQIVKTLHKKIKRSELFTIKNGTHAALYEQPDIFNLLIERFLDPLI